MFVDELHDKEILESTSKNIVFNKTFLHVLNETIHDSWSLPSMLMEVHKDIGHAHSDGQQLLSLDALAALAKVKWHKNISDPLASLSELGFEMDPLLHHAHHDRSHDHVHKRRKRGAGANRKHDMLSESARYRHIMLHELTHAFHLGSMVILTFLVLVTYFKIFVMGRKFLHHKIEVRAYVY